MTASSSLRTVISESAAVISDGEMVAVGRLMVPGRAMGCIKIKEYYIMMIKYCTICFAVCK